MKITYYTTGLGLIVNMIMMFAINDHKITLPIAIIAIGYIAGWIKNQIKQGNS